jgi:Mg2+/Co2+ transporter CorB
MANIVTKQFFFALAVREGAVASIKFAFLKVADHVAFVVQVILATTGTVRWQGVTGAAVVEAFLDVAVLVTFVVVDLSGGALDTVRAVAEIPHTLFGVVFKVAGSVAQLVKSVVNSCLAAFVRVYAGVYAE